MNKLFCIVAATLFLLTIPTVSFAFSTDNSWRMFVSHGSCGYMTPGPDWYKINYDDSSYSSGNCPGDSYTVWVDRVGDGIKNIGITGSDPVYFRKTINWNGEDLWFRAWEGYAGTCYINDQKVDSQDIHLSDYLKTGINLVACSIWGKGADYWNNKQAYFYGQFTPVSDSQLAWSNDWNHWFVNNRPIDTGTEAKFYFCYDYPEESYGCFENSAWPWANWGGTAFKKSFYISSTENSYLLLGTNIADIGSKDKFWCSVNGDWTGETVGFSQNTHEKYNLMADISSKVKPGINNINCWVSTYAEPNPRPGGFKKFDMSFVQKSLDILGLSSYSVTVEDPTITVLVNGAGNATVYAELFENGKSVALPIEDTLDLDGQTEVPLTLNINQTGKYSVKITAVYNEYGISKSKDYNLEITETPIVLPITGNPFVQDSGGGSNSAGTDSSSSAIPLAAGLAGVAAVGVGYAALRNSNNRKYGNSSAGPGERLKTFWNNIGKEEKYYNEIRVPEIKKRQAEIESIIKGFQEQAKKKKEKEELEKVAEQVAWVNKLAGSGKLSTMEAAKELRVLSGSAGIGYENSQKLSSMSNKFLEIAEDNENNRNTININGISSIPQNIMNGVSNILDWTKGAIFHASDGLHALIEGWKPLSTLPQEERSILEREIEKQEANFGIKPDFVALGNIGDDRNAEASLNFIVLKTPTDKIYREVDDKIQETVDVYSFVTKSTIAHEMAHLYIHQNRYQNRWDLQLDSARYYTNTWLDELEADDLIRVKAGVEQFNSKVNYFVMQQLYLIERYTEHPDVKLTKRELEQIVAAELLAERSGDKLSIKNAGNLSSFFINNGLVSKEKYGKIKTLLDSWLKNTIDKGTVGSREKYIELLSNLDNVFNDSYQNYGFFGMFNIVKNVGKTVSDRVSTISNNFYYTFIEPYKRNPTDQMIVDDAVMRYGEDAPLVISQQLGISEIHAEQAIVEFMGAGLVLDAWDMADLMPIGGVIEMPTKSGVKLLVEMIGRKGLQTLIKANGEEAVELVGRIVLKTGRKLTTTEAGRLARFASKLSKSGISNNRIERILSDKSFTNYIVDSEGLDASFGVVKGTKILGVNPIKAAKLSEDGFEFGMRHETKEILKEELRAAGKIPTENDIAKMVDKLDISEAAKKELTETIEERLIADYLVLKEDPRMVKGWSETVQSLLSNIKYFYNKSDKILSIGEENISDIAYLKTLNLSDDIVNHQLNDIISRLSPATKTYLDKTIKTMRSVIENV
ncbi:MAG: hypothetical protein HY362_02370 [Candidatus Aenigmarchaeota archaeon]|nr:hypothetical protein [Candidatus Aenigmarchaeota archaeon]